MEACSLLVNLRERDAEIERAAVSGEDRCVTTLITAAKETSWGGAGEICLPEGVLLANCHSHRQREPCLRGSVGQHTYPVPLSSLFSLKQLDSRCKVEKRRNSAWTSQGKSINDNRIWVRPVCGIVCEP